MPGTSSAKTRFALRDVRYSAGHHAAGTARRMRWALRMVHSLGCERGRRRDWLDRRAELLVKLLNRGERLVVEGKADGLAGFRREIRGEVGLHHAARAFRRHHRRLVPQYALEEVHRL